MSKYIVDLKQADIHKAQSPVYCCHEFIIIIKIDNTT
jgi:hypothetical protein